MHSSAHCRIPHLNPPKYCHQNQLFNQSNERIVVLYFNEICLSCIWGSFPLNGTIFFLQYLWHLILVLFSSLTTLTLQISLNSCFYVESIFWPLFVLLHTFFLHQSCVFGGHEWSHDPSRPIKVFPVNFVRLMRRKSSPLLETIGFKDHISLELPGIIFFRSRVENLRIKTKRIQKIFLGVFSKVKNKIKDILKKYLRIKKNRTWE